ncbi:phosphonate C-P lyase system protein PhnH [Mediterraneibacter glycyrrhizinilyticus]|uniref:phosphonate C-P lyase system protein PhnH n=1 Tax=Mediterraneibacter glycyrrhizinilyticus TaxID=342942 RepID=UPI0019606AC5|nr:phosphonate C-P lyase system protein PhnH [Mediterraneibacter glycyrrhizinilyticus]MBM6753002.1 phosphonate C-P lyase system protein PhnH [Mediterraneibacter glycyrrhizinilyticus]
MAEEIRSVYQFDFVHDGQKVFRELLSAMANPGQIRKIGEQAGKFKGDYASLLALGCTLLDNEEKMYVEKNPRLSSELHNLTLCREADLDQADYVFLSSEMNYGSMEQILKNVKRGTYADPQESATIFLLCSETQGEEEMTLRGPGVDGEKKIRVYPYIKKVIRLRNDLEIEYPLGVDLVFVDGSGNLIGIPRLVKID